VTGREDVAPARRLRELAAPGGIAGLRREIAALGGFAGPRGAKRAARSKAARPAPRRAP
jgi:hypothetical protein